MKEIEFIIDSNCRVAEQTYRMVLNGDTSAISECGQFVQISIPGKFLRRPISVSDCTDGSFVLLYKVVGKGTDYMSKMQAGQPLNVITGLGHGFDPDACKDTALLVGGSVGAAPLLWLAKELIKRGRKVKVALGFANAGFAFYVDEFKALGAEVCVSTDDGSLGVKGIVTAAMAPFEGQYDYFYACGPKVMLRALSQNLDVPGEISMEERMGCGTGICYGCTCQTTAGPRRVCADGPVFKKEEIVW